MKDQFLVQVYPRKHVLDHLDHTARNRQCELNNTENIISISAKKYVDDMPVGALSVRLHHRLTLPRGCNLAIIDLRVGRKTRRRSLR